jgi:GAF domain-containing protein
MTDSSPPTMPLRPTYQALVQAATEATGAASGWLLRHDGDRFTVVAAVGPKADTHHGSARALAGIAGFVAASGQPAAVQPRPDDAANAGAGGTDGVPSSLLAVACGTDDTLGVLELAGAAGGAFSFDDVEVASLLATVAGAALSEGGAVDAPTPPAVLGARLQHLATLDPTRYAAIARALDALV